ncbi:hypothetical protein TVNIR_3359 [Thioalkalivibrio nitratireducens DSM 14787]|uniref:Uncharacterized protein n=1 Tax=Thioalkalivibrio nitratireducens (strain DSM 14787 / UNIQEM 213 / ALEN2) TaxID=1255043 RepID=L0E1B5_THIND|nr:hypothetical protein [Thioalkalivibrio nitratireducens]AGA34995.1 hypothetical protein TVNIR_3359 [Thioalkalivibrio nitratireducens DSM 14787]
MHLDTFTLMGIVAAVAISAFVVRLIAREADGARGRADYSDHVNDDNAVVRP